jgi:hypothetical protein
LALVVFVYSLPFRFIGAAGFGAPEAMLTVA